MFEDIQFIIKRYSSRYMTIGWKFMYKGSAYANAIDNRKKGTTKIELRKYYEEDGTLTELPVEVFDLHEEGISPEKQIEFIKDMAKTMENILEREKAEKDTQGKSYENRED